MSTTPQYLWLFDSRLRGATDGKRFLYTFPETKDGLAKAWNLVLDNEHILDPEDREGYAGYADGADDGEIDTATFNQFWAEYGWCLVLADDSCDLPIDAVVIRCDRALTL